VVVNVAGLPHSCPAVIDCTQSNLFSLDDKSVRILEGLNKPVKIYLLMVVRRPALRPDADALEQRPGPRPQAPGRATLADAEHAGDQGSGQEVPQIDSEGVLIAYGDGKDENASFIRRDDLVSRDVNPMMRTSGDLKFQGETKLMTELSFPVREQAQRRWSTSPRVPTNSTWNDRKRGSDTA